MASGSNDKIVGWRELLLRSSRSRSSNLTTSRYRERPMYMVVLRPPEPETPGCPTSEEPGEGTEKLSP
jgi:hypothetical protein